RPRRRSPARRPAATRRTSSTRASRTTRSSPPRPRHSGSARSSPRSWRGLYGRLPPVRLGPWPVMAEPTPSTPPGRPAAPAVEFAEWRPALGGSRLLRVHGAAPTSEAPTLVLTTPAGEHRVEPRAQSRFTRVHEWRAPYLIASELVTAGWSTTPLEWPGGTRL